jgi:hypothetical protein
MTVVVESMADEVSAKRPTAEIRALVTATESGFGPEAAVMVRTTALRRTRSVMQH